MSDSLKAKFEERIPNVKPLVSVLVKNPVLVTQVARCNPFFQRLCLRRSSIFVSTTNIQCAPISGAWSTTVSGIPQHRVGRLRLYLRMA
jgi:hypothetical protein